MRFKYMQSEELKQESEINSLSTCNTDLSHEPGEYRILLYIGDNKQADYFDSFGSI